MTRIEATHVATVTRHMAGELVDAEDLANALAYLERRALQTLEHPLVTSRGPVAWLEIVGPGWYQL